MVAVGGFLVIPRYGVTGAAALILATRVVIGIVINILVIQTTRAAPT
jgi:hypothetical protein